MSEKKNPLVQLVTDMGKKGKKTENELNQSEEVDSIMTEVAYRYFLTVPIISLRTQPNKYKAAY